MSRDVTLLHPELQHKINAAILLTIAESGNGNIPKWGISETVRTIEEQDALYAKGRTMPGVIVTNARGTDYNSMHQWGVAFDIYRADGVGGNIYYDGDGGFTRICKLLMSVGLEWGGNWSGFVDKPHFQLPNWGSTPKKLKELYKTPNNFRNTWNQTQEKPLSAKDIEALKAIAALANAPTLEEDKKRKALIAIANLPRYTVNAKNGLRWRDKPSLNGKVYSVLKNGSTVIGTGKTSGIWIECAPEGIQGRLGWCSNEYLKRK